MGKPSEGLRGSYGRPTYVAQPACVMKHPANMPQFRDWETVFPCHRVPSKSGVEIVGRRVACKLARDRLRRSLPRRMLGLSLTEGFLHGARQNLPAYSPDSVVRAGGVQAGAERAGAGMADLPTLGTVADLHQRASAARESAATLVRRARASRPRFSFS